MGYIPPFTVSAEAVSKVAEISALVGRSAIRPERRDFLKLRRSNQIKSIQASLAIEGNTLSEAQVAAVLDGRPVVAPPREIQEVKNAIAVYDNAEKLDPFSVDDLLKAHGIMMAALTDDAGCFRRGGVGVADGGKIIHVAPPAERVPHLIAELFGWLRGAKDHLLIRSCVFHYEFEFIHPFSDGNGRIGRFWQSLLLSKFDPAFIDLPVETMVHDNQKRYYQAINASSAAGDSGVFIDFMLGEILRTLLRQIEDESVGVNVGVNAGRRGDDLLDFVRANPGLRANAIASALGMNQRTVERRLAKLRGQIEFRGAARNGGYFVK